MQINRFIKGIEGYYGAYSSGVKPLVAKYLTKYSEAQLDILFDRVLVGYSGQYKHTPDIAVFEKISQEISREGWTVSKQQPRIEEGERVTNEEGLRFIRAILQKLSKKKTARGGKV